MERKHMNRQATRRISISVTVCLSLLASCVAKPVEQDLASGDATVEIKYLDSVTMDIIDDTRTRRRKFYETALNDPDKKYSQGKQGAIDRESTFAAAINANAQRDQSVLERYSAEGNRQLSALENSEELGDETIEHNKKLISQTNDLNDAKVKAVESQAETLAELNKAKVEAANTLVKEYQAELERISGEMEELEKTLAGYKEDLKAATDAEKAELQKKITAIEGADGTRGSGSRFKTLQDKKESTAGTLNKLFTDAAGGIISNAGLLGTNMELNDKKFGSYPLDPTASITYKWVADSNDKINGGKFVPEAKYEFNPSQLPQAAKPNDADYLSSALEKLDKIKAQIENLASSDSKKALDMGVKLNSPPIERIRNDEAVFDYLLDGYRNTQIYSGAEYGGMVRRVLPFSFTFTPGSSTKSGFSARVVLRPDQQQLDEAAKMIAPHLNAVNRDRIAGYAQQYKKAEGEENFTRLMLTQEYDDKCGDVTHAFGSQENFYNEISYIWPKTLIKPDEQQFWRAYHASVEAVIRALKSSTKGEQSLAIYKYNLQYVIADIENSINEINKANLAHQHGHRLGLANSSHSDVQAAAAYATCVLNSILKEKTKLGSLGMQEDEKVSNLLDNFMKSIDHLVMNMTSAGLVHEVYLQGNLLFADAGKKMIHVREDAVCPPGKGRCYQASVADIQPNGVDFKKSIKEAAGIRIIQNTSREHVVEVPDTAKINTLLSAGGTGNEVTQQLGLTLGAEIAAAVSSSSAFMKRIPYAVPFTGQSLCNGCERKDDTQQSFGWKYYKTPSGVTQFGGVAQSFKTIPLNSAVVVSMPEWMSKLTADYEISEDAGRTWKKPVGGENIVLSGASLRGMIPGHASTPFDTWVKYHIYGDIDQSVGMPKLTSCYGEKSRYQQNSGSASHFIYGSSNGATAICGQNLHGVKGILVGGRMIDDGIEKISSSLIKVKDFDLGPQDCPEPREGEQETCEHGDKCEVILLSDFGPSHDKDNTYCLQFKHEPKKGTANDDILTEPKVRVEAENVVVYNIPDRFFDRITHYILSDKEGPEYEITINAGIPKFPILTSRLKDICLQKKSEPCTIDLFVRLKNEPTEITLLGKINMDELHLWDPFPTEMPIMEFNECNSTTDNQECKIHITHSEYNQIFLPEFLFIGTQRKRVNPPATVGNKYTFTVSKANLKTYCAGSPVSQCKVELTYTKADDIIINLGVIKSPE